MSDNIHDLIERCHPLLQNGLGDMHHLDENDKKAVHWYRKAAEQGYAEAQFNLGLAYDNGEGVEQNFEEAVAW